MSSSLDDGYQQQSALASIPSEQDNSLETVVRSAETFHDVEDVEGALRAGKSALEAAREAADDVATARALRVLVGAELLRGDLKAAEAMASRELDLFQELDCTWGEASMLLSLAQVDVERAGVAERSVSRPTCELAMDWALEALGLFRDLQPSHEWAWYMEGCSHLVLASIYHKKGQATDVRQAANSALAIFKEWGDPRNEACALHSLALAHAMLGRHWDAMKASRNALKILTQLGLRRLAAIEYLAIASWHELDNNWSEVLTVAEDSLALYRSLDMQSGEVSALTLVVKAHCALGDASTARRKTEECLEIMRAARSQREVANLLEVLAGIHLAAGSKQEAVDTTEDALQTVRELEDKKWEANLLYALVQLLLELQQMGAAWTQASAALDFFAKNNFDSLAAATRLHILVPLHLWRQDFDEALKTALDGFHYYQKTGDEAGEGTALFLIACLHSDNGSRSEASRMFKKAQALCQDNGDYRLEAKVCRTVAGISLEQGQPAEAARFAHEARSLYNKAKDMRMEVSMCMFAAKCHVASSKVLATPHAVRAEEEKAMKCALAGKTLARKLGEPRLLADALLEVGMVAVVQRKGKDAKSAIDQALVLFQECGHKPGEASAQLLLAEALECVDRRTEAAEAADEALRIFLELGDSEGAARARASKSKILPSKPDPVQSAGPTAAAEAQKEQIDTGASAAMPVAAVVEESKKALDPEVVKTTIYNLVGDLIGSDLGSDEAFMDAGLDSLLAIQFRQELVGIFSGLGLSSTITFDYPTTRALSDHIVEKSQDALEN